MNISPDQLIANILEQHQTKSLLLFGSEQPPAVKKYLQLQSDSIQIQNIDKLSTLANLANLETRFDLCLIAPELAKQDKQSGIELLAGIRNRFCHHIYLFIPLGKTSIEKTNWQESDLFSLGLKRLAEFKQKSSKPQIAGTSEPVLNCFAYQIESYIKKRDWNNARFWANPEQFGKHWW